MKILVIDDDEAIREHLKETLPELNEGSANWCVREADFDRATDLLLTFRPDIIVLDLVAGNPAKGDAVGNQFFEKIREMWFCPIVVYSAAVSRNEINHPLVKTVTKGANSEMKIMECIKGFLSIARDICLIHVDFDAQIRTALHDSADHLPDASYLTKDSRVLIRNVRRLVAARTDIRSDSDEKLEAWERFVIPPLENHLLTADLLKKKGAYYQDINDFRLVLTPSCDMVHREGELPKVNQILVACCESLEEFENMQLKSGKRITNKQKQKLKYFLTQGMGDSHIPIPGLKDCIPLMAANLKRLELIGWDQLCLGSSNIEAERNTCVYERVASIDSPFREMVVWAYLRVSGRPGLPDVNIGGWLKDIECWLSESG